MKLNDLSPILFNNSDDIFNLKRLRNKKWAIILLKYTKKN